MKDAGLPLHVTRPNDERDTRGSKFCQLVAVLYGDTDADLYHFKDLTADARKRKKHELARQTMDQLEKLNSVSKARQSVAAITAKWQAKIDSA